MKRPFVVVGIALGVFLARAVFAVDPSSANYSTQSSTFVPAVFNASSPNYQINGSIDPMVGESNSTNFSLLSGVPLPQGTAAPTPPSGGTTPSAGGGGGGATGASIGYIPPPTFLYRTPTFLSHQRASGSRATKDTTILVNGSADGVSYPTDLTWARDLPLFLGMNRVIVQGKIPSGYVTPGIFGDIERMLIGDVNRDHRVDDRDLSKFVRAWNVYTPFADFNEDKKVNDIDLSLLVSHWGQSY